MPFLHPPQDIIESIKLATILAPLTTPEYRDWPMGRQAVMTLASKNGYEAIGMKGAGGELKVGMVADVTLWDLTSLALLPRTDPISLLALGSRTQAKGAGSTLHSAWVRGVRTVEAGEPLGVDLQALRNSLLSGNVEYRDQVPCSPSMVVRLRDWCPTCCSTRHLHILGFFLVHRPRAVSAATSPPT
jgi:hypothetical protein